MELGNIYTIWSLILSRLRDDNNYRPERSHLDILDEDWTEVEPFKGNIGLIRLKSALEDLGLDTCFRTLLEMDETNVQEILSLPQIGRASRDFMDAVRDPDSPWSRCFEEEQELERVNLSGV